MTKRLAETAFDIVSEHFANNGARKKATIRTLVMHNKLMRISDNIDDVISHVDHLNPAYENIINTTAAYLDQDPRELWYQNDTGRVCGFLERLRQDIDALAIKCIEWRCQAGLGALSATLHDQWLRVPRLVVKGWLQQESEVECQTYSDTVYQVHDILDMTPDLNPHLHFLKDLADASGNLPPPSLTEQPTGLTDHEGEDEESDDE